MIAIEEEEKKPKTQPQVDRGGSGKPPRPTAVGMADGGDDDDNYVRGQILNCMVGPESPLGYVVFIDGSQITGILTTDEYYNFGQRIKVSFSHWSDNGVPMVESPDEQTRKEASKFDSTQEHPAQRRKLPPVVNIKTPFARLFARSVISQNEFFGAVQIPNKSKRAVDMFPPPLPDSKSRTYHVATTDYLKSRLKKFQKEKFTGCLMAESNSFYSRGAMLMFRGMCMGAIYSNNFEQKIDDTRAAMRTLLMELYSPGSSFHTYTLPEEIVLSFASLLVGNSIEDKFFGEEQIKYSSMLGKFSELMWTGVISVELSEPNEMILVFICDGNMTGYFKVQERKIATDTTLLHQSLVRAKKIKRVDAFKLPEEEIRPTEFNPIVYIPGKLFY